MSQRFFTRRVLISALVLALALGSAAGFLSTDADAAGGQEIEHMYFSDASHSQIVGIWLKTCWGGVYSSGPRTPYKVTTYSPCF